MHLDNELITLIQSLFADSRLKAIGDAITSELSRRGYYRLQDLSKMGRGVTLSPDNPLLSVSDSRLYKYLMDTLCPSGPDHKDYERIQEFFVAASEAYSASLIRRSVPVPLDVPTRPPQAKVVRKLMGALAKKAKNSTDPAVFNEAIMLYFGSSPVAAPELARPGLIDENLRIHCPFADCKSSYVCWFESKSCSFDNLLAHIQYHTVTRGEKRPAPATMPAPHPAPPTIRNQLTLRQAVANHTTHTGRAHTSETTVQVIVLDDSSSVAPSAPPPPQRF